MKKDVLIHVRGLQMMDPEEEQEPIEIVVPGQYYYRNGSHYLRYEEMMDDTDRKSTRLNSSHTQKSRMPSSA